MIVTEDYGEIERVEQVFDPQTVEAFAVNSIKQTDANDVHQTRFAAHGVRAFFERVPHVFPRVSVFTGRGMKTRFGHDEDQRNADQYDSHRANLKRKSHIVRADQRRRAYADQRREQSDLCCAQK